jgi:polysaccharide deacetylase 2 family uncharacterized protein YibQ
LTVYALSCLAIFAVGASAGFSLALEMGGTAGAADALPDRHGVALPLPPRVSPAAGPAISPAPATVVRRAAPAPQPASLRRPVRSDDLPRINPRAVVRPVPAATPPQRVVQPPPTPVAEAPAQTQASAPQQAALPPAPAVAPRVEPPSGAQPQWQRFAAAWPQQDGRPRIAIVMDDVGIDKYQARRAIALPGPLTMAILPYPGGLPALAREARAAGHELLLHMPMEPLDDDENDPGPNALYTAMNDADLRVKLRWALSRFDGFVGVNNHMGSKFSRDERALRVVMQELRRQDLLFLDSRTTSRSLAWDVARAEGVPSTYSDVFLDNVDDYGAVRAQLAQVERVAHHRGHAIAIGHPRDATLAALGVWLAELPEKGFVLVPVSAIVGAAQGVLPPAQIVEAEQPAG